MKHGTITGYYKGCRCASCKGAHRVKNRDWLRANPEKIQIYNRRKNLKQYGLTLERWDEIYAAQKGCCRICEQPCRTGKRLAVDHDHETGAIRGLLCYRCNIHLGWLEPNYPAIMDYLLSGEHQRWGRVPERKQ